MPRNRTVRLAVLGSSVQRAAASGYPSNRSSAVKRRIIVGVLILLSLVLITLSFRSNALDGAQGTAADVLRPFEIGADRVARPFQDAAGWAHGVVNAKSQNSKLRKQVRVLQQQLDQDASAAKENANLKQLLNYKGPPTIADFDRVNAAVLTGPPSDSDQSITVAAGSTARVAIGDVVVTRAGLVGTVAKVFSHVSRVTLITDEQSAVTATDLDQPTAVGIVEQGNGGGNVLIMDQVSKEQQVGDGDTIVTNGSLGHGLLPSMFPRGIPVGTVTSASIDDVNPFQNIQVQPFVDFTSLLSVIVLVPKR